MDWSTAGGTLQKVSTLFCLYHKSELKNVDNRTYLTISHFKLVKFQKHYHASEHEIKNIICWHFKTVDHLKNNITTKNSKHVVKHLYY